MKKFLAILISALTMGTACIMTACNNVDYTVGIIQLVTHPALDAATQGFMDALQEEMDKAGKTVEFDLQNASNETALCSTISSNFVAKNYDLIMANSTPALQAAAESTLSIPILGTSVTEYGVALGIENFSGTVGSNISGTSDLADLNSQAQMILDFCPDAKTIGLLYCSAEPNSSYQVNQVKSYLEGKGKTCQIYTFTDSNDISAVVNGIVGNADAVYVPTDNTVAANTEIIDSILRPANIPVIAGEEGICSGCGIATLSISYYGIGLKTGKMAAEILLEGKPINTMAIAYDESPVYKYNATICKDLGITVPSNYVVIEGTEIGE